MAASASSIAAPPNNSVPVGSTWTRVPHDINEFGGAGDQIPIDVTAGGPGFVAIGNDSVGPKTQPAVWLSEDGMAWSRSPLSTTAVDPTTAVLWDSIATGADGTIVVVGTEGIGCVDTFRITMFGACERTRPAAWWSADGATWNRVADEAQVFHDGGDSTMIDVVATDFGFLAIANRRVQAEWTIEILASADGRAWRRAHSIDRDWPLGATSLAATEVGVIAFIREFPDRIVEPRQATEAGGGWVLSGTTVESPAATGQLVSVTLDATSFIDQLVGTADAFGSRRGGGPLTWSESGTVFALSSGENEVRTIQSTTDGVSWEPSIIDAVPSAFDTIGVVATPDGLTMVQFSIDGDTLATPSWVSSDGASWEASGVVPPPLARVETGAEGSGGRSGSVHVIISDNAGQTAVAVGSDDTLGDADAAFWYSTAILPNGETEAPSAAATTPDYSTPVGCKMETDAQCRNSNLDGADLAGVSAPGIDLSASNLAGANLIGANLAGADLTAADLRGADLTGADLKGAILDATRFDRAILDGADLTGAVIELTDFSAASMRAVTATATDFDGSGGDGSILDDSDLTEANLSSSSFRFVRMRNADLSRSNLRGANVSGALAGSSVFRDADLQGASFGGAQLVGTAFDNIVGRSAVFTGANLRDATMDGADLTSVSLFGADLRGIDFSGSTIRTTNFIEANLTGATLPTDGLDTSDWGLTTCPDGFVTGRYPSGSCASFEGAGS